jgi:GH35 family endo-1,4-beta-xylanase
MFGFSDRYAWDALGDASPLVFDEDYRAKPAYFAIQAALAGDPNARLFR